MTAYLLQPEHLAHLYLGVCAPALLIALVVAHFATRTLGVAPAGRTYNPAPVVLEVAADATTAVAPGEHVGAQDDAATSAWLFEAATATTFDDDSDDAVPVDMAALMVEQDREEGEEFVSRVEAYIALETAVTFGFVYLGAPR